MSDEKHAAMMELQMIAPQVKQLKEHIENIEAQVQELMQTKKALGELQECTPGSAMLAQVSTGMFVKSEIKETDKVILNVGAQVGVEKNIDEANKLVDEQIEEVSKVRDHFITQFEPLRDRMMELHSKVE